MRSEITNIRLVYKYGAFGNPDKMGIWIYGTRPDGKTVACKNKHTENGGIKIWSYWKSPTCKDNEIDVCVTEFSKEEWEKIQKARSIAQQFVCNQILEKREK